MNNSSIIDQSERDQALNPGSSFIVQAPAGSGKTELISQRFLTLLTQCEKPESVLAITFTRKAANEMRIRILNALESAQVDDLQSPQEAHKKITMGLAKAVLKRDKQQQWNLLSNPSRLRVVTIDSFNAELTRQMPLLSKMGASTAPIDDPNPLYLEAARRTLNALEEKDYQADLSILMPHLDNNIQRIQQLLVTMLAKRDQWLRHLIQSQNGSTRRDELEKAFYNLIEDHLSHLNSLLPSGLIDELCDLAYYASNHVDCNKQARITRWSSMEQQQLSANPDQLLFWQGLADLLLTQKGELRKSVTKAIGFPAPSSTTDVELKNTYQQKKDSALSLLNEIGQYPELVQAIATLQDMPALTYTDKQWQLIQALSRIMLLSAGHLKIVFSEHGQVDFTEIAESALEALGHETQPTDLAMILDYKLQHILIDEFQDTSQGQFKLLQKLTHGWQVNDGRTLFLVGDPMQSIYRFREAEVGLYLNARQHGIGDIELESLNLSVNFRSQKKIVDWINHHLTSIFAQKENITTGAVTYSSSTPFHPALSEDAVILRPFAERDDLVEANEIIKIVKQSLTKNKTLTVAILVRSRSHLNEIIQLLKSSDIPFQAIDLDQLQSQAAIIDLYTLTRAVHHVADRLHWLAFLRAPWCGLKLEDLLIIANGPHHILWENCLNNDVQNSLTSDGANRLRNLIQRLTPFFEQHYRMSLRTWLEGIWNTLGGNIIYNSSTDTETIQSFFNLIEKHQTAGRINDMTAFDDALEKLYAPVDSLADGRLQIMTIHKSKGLEFDTVILPGLGKQGRHDESRLLEWIERPNQHGQIDLLMAPIKSSKSDRDDDISKSIKAINSIKSQNELTRLLYVALTRAKQRLYLFAHAKADNKGNLNPSSNSLLNILWPMVANQFEDIKETKIVTTVNPIKASQQVLQRINTHWQPEIPHPLSISVEDNQIQSSTDFPSIEFDWASETAKHIGTLTHAYLEHISNDSLENWNSDVIDSYHHSIKNSLNSLGTQTKELDTATKKVIQALKNTLSDERGHWILKNQHKAHSEYGLTAKTESGFKRYIIDRTFIDENGIRWIIDYKTGNHEGSDKEHFLDQEKQRYQSQLENYARLMQKIDSFPIRLGLYFPMLKGWREWEYKLTN